MYIIILLLLVNDISGLPHYKSDSPSGLRCRDLDRYLKRLAKHPTVRKDPDFRMFLQEVKLSENIEVKRSFGQKISHTIEKWNNRTIK